MAVIYSYPQKGSVVDGDLFVITDPADSNKTKTVTAQTLANYVDGEVTLQEVLDTGNTANNQSITLTGAPASISSSTVTATTSATIANVTHSSSNILSSADLTIANTTGLLILTGPNDINITSTANGINLTTGALAGDDIVLNAGEGDVEVNASDFDVNTATFDITATTTGTINASGASLNLGASPSPPTNINMRVDGGNVGITSSVPSTGAITSQIPFQGANGTVTNPTHSFTNDVDTGFYLEAAGRAAISVGGANAMQLQTTANKSNVPFQLSNSGGVNANAYELLTRFENGTFEPYWTDGNAPLAGAVYASQVGSYIIWQNTLYGYFRIKSSAIPTPPVTGLGINGTIVDGTGAGATLEATFPKVNNTGSSVTIGTISGAAAGTGAPIGGFVSVGTPGQLMVLQTYTSGTDYNRVASLPAMGPTYTIEGTFAYVFE